MLLAQSLLDGLEGEMTLEPGETSGTVEAPGTPSGLQLAASPQFCVPAPPSHVEASTPTLPIAK